MKKLMVALLFGALAMAVMPAGAGSTTKTLHFDASVPCAAVGCSYWQPDPDRPGAYQGVSLTAGLDLDGTPAEGTDLPIIEKDYDKASDFQTGRACTEPF